MNKIYAFLLSFIWISFTYAQDYSVFTGPQAHQKIAFAEKVRWNNLTQTPNYIQFEQGHQPLYSLEFIQGILKLSSNFNLIFTKSEQDQLGWLHVRFQLHFQNIPVEGTYWVAHIYQGKIMSMNGDLFLHSKTESEQWNVQTQAAIQKAKEFMGPGIWMWEIPAEEAWIKESSENPNATYFPSPQKTWVITENKLSPAWKMNVYRSTPLAHQTIFVSAQNGRIFDSYDLIHTGDANGSAKTVYSGTQPIVTDSISPVRFQLKEAGRGKGIETRNLNRGTNYASSTAFNDSDNYWNNVNSLKDEYATDAHFGTEVTYDYFKIKHNRKSYDNNDAKLWSYVHYSNNFDNAFWDGTRMTYGDGNQLKPLTTLDICGHEIAHGVTSNSAQLVYRNESGALNESFSDIFGTEIEFFVKKSSGNYAIGEQSTPSGTGIRNMANPALFQDPAEYKGPNWYTGTGDNGGVHINSGVQNYWFYVLVEGKKGTNFKGKAYDVKSIGHDKAAAIAYRNLTVYLGPNSSYPDACFYSIQAAGDLYGSCSNEVEQTTNAWLAAGIGNGFDTIVQASFYARNPKTCSTTDSIIFVNTSKNAGAFAWDFGDGNTSSLKNPHHAYASQGTYTVKLTIFGCQGGSDSVTLSQYIQINSSYFGCNPNKMGTSGSNTITACQGLLQDDGGNGNYASNVNYTTTIAPANGSRVRLNFLAFNLEGPGDYMIIYDGNSTAAPVLGVYTGNELPEGGIVYSSGNAITVQLRTDAAGTQSGFNMEWECQQRVNLDAGIQAVHIPNGRELTSLTLSNNKAVKVRIRNYGTSSLTKIPVAYQVNGGTVILDSAVISLNTNDTGVFTFKTTADFSVPGYYQISVWTTLKNDSNTGNDTFNYVVRHIPNGPVSLPYTQDFENLGPQTFNFNLIGMDTLGEMDYSNNRNGYGRLRTQAGPDFPESGKSALTLDQYPATQNNGAQNTNFLVLTLNMAQEANEKIYLDFSYLNHGEENHTNDKVWVRGSDKDAWIQVYDLFANAPTSGTYKRVTSIDLSTPIKNAGKTLTSSFQIRWGQQDNASASMTALGDGITLDNIKVWKEVVDIAIDSISSPRTECGLGSQEPITFRVVNKGTGTFSDSITISTKLNGVTLNQERVKATLGLGQSTWITLVQKADLSAQTWHSAFIQLNTASDKLNDNDSLTAWAFNYPSMNNVVVSANGTTAICSGDSVEISATSGFATYRWSNGSTSPSIWVKSGGNYFCTVTGANPCERKSNAVAVTVKPKPSGGFNFFIKTDKRTVDFTQLAFNFDSLIWDFGDGNSSTQLNPSHTYQTEGTYTVKLTMKNACGTNTFSYKITLVSLGTQEVENAAIQIFPNPSQGNVTITGLMKGRLLVYSITGQLINEMQIQEGNRQLSLNHLPEGMYWIENRTTASSQKVRFMITR